MIEGGGTIDPNSALGGGGKTLVGSCDRRAAILEHIDALNLDLANNVVDRLVRLGCEELGYLMEKRRRGDEELDTKATTLIG
jgi:hypothetical protein